MTVIQSPNESFSKILIPACANWTLQTDPGTTVPFDYPCTIYETSDSQGGMLYPNETFLTINNLSPQNQVLQVSAGNATAGDLFILGPAGTQTSSDSDFRATTIGVSTSCQAISTLCNLNTLDGANTIFNCSPGFTRDIESGLYHSPGLIPTQMYIDGLQGNYTSAYNNFGLAVFADHNLTKAYEISNSMQATTTRRTILFTLVSGLCPSVLAKAI
jgi:hypothetical protein